MRKHFGTLVSDSDSTNLMTLALITFISFFAELYIFTAHKKHNTKINLCQVDVVAARDIYHHYYWFIWFEEKGYFQNFFAVHLSYLELVHVRKKYGVHTKRQKSPKVLKVEYLINDLRSTI